MDGHTGFVYDASDPRVPSRSSHQEPIVMPARSPSAALLWLVFIGVAFAWGSSYFFIKIGVESGLQPFTLVALRLAISIIGLGLLLALTRSRLPRDPRVLADLAIVGIINVAIPFTLITWAERSIDSALASILQGLTPLFSLVMAGIVLQDEPITVNKLAGLVVGFAGAVVILARHLAPVPGGDPTAELLGELALVLSCVSYAASGVFLRRRIGTRPLNVDPATGPRPLRPAEIALPQNAVAFFITALLAIVLDPGSGLPASAAGWISVLWLGLVGSSIAYLLFFRLLNAWGAYRTSLITYAMPVVGILLGVIVLGETIGPQTIVGTVMVIGGIALANARIGQRRVYGRSPARVPD
jgi:drug/metabolite transporter (DMT)-like permease